MDSNSNQQQPSIVSFLNLSPIKISDEFKFGNCRNVNEYEKLNRVGEGTYGVVYRARHIQTNKVVALKRVRMDNEKDGLPISKKYKLSKINLFLLFIKKEVLSNLMFLFFLADFN
jgi:serine/threonine protein kinase